MSLFQRLRNVFKPDLVDRELEDEFEYHVAETVDRLVENGMSEAEAIREARRRLGNYCIQKEKTRDMNIAAWLDATRADVVYALRQLRMNPGFTTVAVLSLALGIGANTSMFQLVNAIQLRSLPISNPQELASINFQKGSSRGGWWSSRVSNFTFAQWEQIRDTQQAFSGVLAWSAGRFNLAAGGQPRYVENIFVSGNYFEMLGVRPALGRTFTAEDDTPKCSGGAVLSHAFWQREYAGDPNVLGRVISLSGVSMPVIGVTNAAFFGLEVGSRFDVAVPLCSDPLFAENKKGRIHHLSAWWLSMMGRLKPGVSVQSATANLRAISPAVMRTTIPPEYKPDMAKKFLANKLEAVEAGTGISSLRRQFEQPLWLLMATTGLVLLIACANLANLLLARATVRETEIAVRLAIGASRFRLIRQLLVESLLLAVGGAALGALVSIAVSRTLVSFLSTSDDPVFVDLATDWRVLGFTAGLALLTCILFGLLPALRATHLSPASAMRAGGRSVTAGKDRFSMRRVLVSVQVALSFVLLVGALLFVRSLHNLMTNDAGFTADGVLITSIDFAKADFPKERRHAIYRELEDRLSAIPGVVTVGQTGSVPLTGNTWDSSVGTDGAPAAGSGKSSFFNWASPGYFKAMGTRLLAGRDFNSYDNLQSPRIAIVNEVFSRKFFGVTNPVGHTFHLEAGAGQQEKLFQVVGMVANTKYMNLHQDFVPLAYFPMSQNGDPEANALFVLKIAGPAEAVIAKAKTEVLNMGPTIGIDFRPFAVQLRESITKDRLMATLSGGFGVLAVLLATLGLYGVIAYMVARRRNEIGVRIALGADRRHVLGLVLREAAILIGVGLFTGTLLALWAGKAAGSMLFGLQSNDVVSLVSASALLSGIALLASYVPARRAAALDPVETLRN